MAQSNESALADRPRRTPSPVALPGSLSAGDAERLATSLRPSWDALFRRDERTAAETPGAKAQAPKAAPGKPPPSRGRAISADSTAPVPLVQSSRAAREATPNPESARGRAYEDSVRVPTSAPPWPKIGIGAGVVA